MRHKVARLCALVCVLALALSMAVPAAASDVVASGVTEWYDYYDYERTFLEQSTVYVAWELSADGTMICSPTNAQEVSGDRFEELKDDVRTVVIEPGIGLIGSEAFWWFKNLSSVTIPDDIVVISNDAFARCSSLTEIRLPEGLKAIGDWAFSESGLTGTVTLPASLEEIKTNPFELCENLSAVTMASGNPYMQFVTTEDGSEMLLSADGTQLYTCLKYGNKKTVRIPDGVVRVHDGAFYKGYGAVNYARTVVVPASVTELENLSLTYPDRVIFEGTNAPEMGTSGYGDVVTTTVFGICNTHQTIVYYPQQAQGAYEAAWAKVPPTDLKVRAYAGENEKQAALQKDVFLVQYLAPDSEDLYEGTLMDEPTTAMESGEVYTVKSLPEVSYYEWYHGGEGWVPSAIREVFENMDAYFGWADTNDGTIYPFGQQLTVTKDLDLIPTKEQTPPVPEQTIDARYDPARDHRYAYDVNGNQILGVSGESVTVSPEGDLRANGNIYYMNPDRDPANPDSCYLMTNYVRVRPNDGGRTFYDADGISFYGWMHAEGGGMRFQTRLENVPGQEPYCIFVWHAQYLDECQHPDHPGDAAYNIPAGWYLFGDDGVRILGSGEYEFKYDVDQQVHHYTLTDGRITAIDGVPV